MISPGARLLTLGAAVLALAGCSEATPGPSEPGTGTEPAATTDVRCADLVVLGARGSTQDPDLNDGVGTEVRRTTDELARRLHGRSGLTVRIEAIRYDAGATATRAAYQRHTVEGTRMMLSRLRTLASTCADSRFALLGFSQGAQVVHGAATDMPGDLAGRVVLVAMIADPLRDPTDAIAHWSYAEEPTRGNGRLGAGPPISAALRPAAISLCVEGDEICNARGAPGDPPSEVHKHFYERPAAVRATAARLDAVLRRNGL
ncbi:cutinase family protein [Aeromicrobium wangtongii]|uniref:cutinase family protein n=1 Tax=Aeromicrobium wangtongii TaxID=2969247 RepID=UPI0020175E56|nr:cutinase family protein [Aeromicrobium wangtongii]MCL3819680.1 cutinase family protein [Aeromicrobium wangtongii]